MKTLLRVLSDEELTRIHEQTLRLLADPGLRVDSARARRLLGEAGAQVEQNSRRVRFPRALVEQALRLAPRDFDLHGRRPGWSLPVNRGACALILDGGAIHVHDAQTGQRRPPVMDDWLLGTRLSDALDDFGCFWNPVEGLFEETPGGTVAFMRAIFQNFSKHVQESFSTPELARWALEALEIIFGSREAIRRDLPFSFLICPESPLGIDEHYTDACLAALEWGIPVAAMPMPLLGMTGPGTLISHLVLCNCETLAGLCLVQAAAPGTPFIYAPVPAIANPRSGRYGGGEVEHALTFAAVSEMAHSYNLPVEASAGGADPHVPGIQVGYESALNYTLPVLSEPDLLVGPGSLGGSTVFSAEQLVLDVEVIRRCKRLGRGIEAAEGKWLEEVIRRAGPGGTYMAQASTRDALRAGEIHLSRLGVHDSYERWQAGGKPDILEQAREQIAQVLAAHPPLPLDETRLRALEQLERRARRS